MRVNSRRISYCGRFWFTFDGSSVDFMTLDGQWDGKLSGRNVKIICSNGESHRQSSVHSFGCGLKNDDLEEVEESILSRSEQ